MALSERLIVLVIRVVLFFVYLVVGAAVFQALEQDNQKINYERKQRIRQRIQAKYNMTASDIQEWTDTYKANMQFQGGEELEWDFGNSFLFAAVTVTTIGYGNVVPKTLGGRLFCILYAFIGIPCTCLTLKVIGDTIYDITAGFILVIEQRVLKRENVKDIELKTVVFNMVLSVFIVLPLLAAIVYVREVEHWTYFECFYFTFTTLTTIGYGDYVPYFGTSLDFLLLLVALFGLAFVSSILCSLNNLFEAYGLSKRVVKSMKKIQENDESPQSGTDELLDEVRDTMPDLPRNSITPRPSIAREKRGSIAVGMIQA